MEGDPQSAPIASPEAAAPAAPATPESAPPYQTWQDRLARAFDTLPADDPRAASNGAVADPPTPAPEDDDDEDDESTPDPEGVKPAASDDGKDKPAAKPGVAETGEKPLSRRQQREQENQQRIAALEAERDAAVAKAREEARAEFERERAEATTREQQEALARTNAADVERYERLIRLPINSLDAEDFNWLEERKELLAKYPEAEQHFRALAERVLTDRQQALDADHQNAVNTFWNGVRTDMATAKDVPGVDFEAVRAAPTFAERDRILYSAGAATKDAEYQPQIAAKDAEIAKHSERITELENEVRDLRLVGPRGLGAARAPVQSGVQSGDATASPRKFDEHRSSKDNLAAALGF